MASCRGLRGSGATAVAVALCCCAMIWFTATAAQAHASLVRSSPSAGSVVDRAPGTVSLTFGEQVLAADAGVQVYDDRFAEVEVGPAASAVGDPLTLVVALPSGLGRGTYTVAWRVSSGDTHPVAGSFRFSIGTPSQVVGALPTAGRNEGVGTFLGVLRWFGFVGAALGPGAVVGALLVWPAGLAARRLRRVVGTGLALLVVSTVGGMLLQGVFASGQPLSALWQAPRTLDSHSERFDRVYAVRSYLLVAATVGVVALLGLPPAARDRWRRVWVAVAAVATLALLATWPLVGHSAVPPGEGFAVVVNLVHLSAMVLWLGGLTVVLVGLMGERDAMPRTGLQRFSWVALVCVTLLVASGVVLAWREVGTVGALGGTTFGQIVLVKTAAVVVLLGVANHARRWVAMSARTASDDVGDGDGVGTERDPGSSRFRHGLVGEVALAAVILGLTAALVSVVPGRQAAEVPSGSSVSSGTSGAPAARGAR